MCGFRPDDIFCSRVCCSQAINNAIKLKEANPDMEIAILYRDIRSYGMHELHYRKAREMGVTFIHFDVDKKPEVSQENGKLTVKVLDKNLNREIVLEPDWLVLSAAIRPQADVDDFASRLKLPLTQEKFMMEAHMKLRPVDLVNEGMYLCGLAHSPKTRQSIAGQGTCPGADHPATFDGGRNFICGRPRSALPVLPASARTMCHVLMKAWLTSKQQPVRGAVF
jgi:heterodisulfide reductase subunit A-like polyferredoxin